MDLYQVCSYDAPGVKTGPAQWLTSENIGAKKITSKLAGRRRASIFGMYHLLLDLYQVCSYDALGSNLALPWESQDGTWEQSRPTSKFFLSETGRHGALIFGM